jgi:hypothetical protein
MWFGGQRRREITSIAGAKIRRAKSEIDQLRGEEMSFELSDFIRKMDCGREITSDDVPELAVVPQNSVRANSLVV